MKNVWMDLFKEDIEKLLQKEQFVNKFNNDKKFLQREGFIKQFKLDFTW
jgi:hypothetical protein